MSQARPAASLPFDPRPLNEPVERGAVRAFAQAMGRAGAGGSAFGGGASSVIAIVVIGVMIVFVGSIMSFTIGGIIFALSSTSGNAGWFASVGAVLPTVLIAGALALLIVFAVRGSRGAQERRYRLYRFAGANGMSYLPTLASPALPGMIFGVGGSRTASDLVRGEQPRFVEFANYRYTTGSGKNRTTHKWGYVAIKLDVPLPHIVLDATSNNGLFGASNLPASFDKDQRLGLEGDFDQHFSLYCPQGYERDALYLFTPDIMARFIDNAAALDVEIVDDWLFLYAKRDFSTLDAATWAWLFSVVAALLGKLAQWARWRDERLRLDAAGFGVGGASGPGGSAGASGPVGAIPANGMVAQGAGMTPGAVAPGGEPSGAASAGAALPFAAPPGLLTPPPPGVAAPGRRLTRRFSWITIVIVVAFVVVQLLTQTGFLGLLFSR